jgi:hypothetical protein
MLNHSADRLEEGAFTIPGLSSRLVEAAEPDSAAEGCTAAAYDFLIKCLLTGACVNP